MTAQELFNKAQPIPATERYWQDGIGITRVDKMKWYVDQIYMLYDAYAASDKRKDADLRDTILINMGKLLKECQLVYFGLKRIEFLHFGFCVNKQILISYLNQEWKSMDNGSEWHSYTTIQDLLCDYYDTYLGEDIPVIEKRLAGNYRLELFMFNMDDVNTLKKKESK
jgi:hypothetical protein